MSQLLPFLFFKGKYSFSLCLSYPSSNSQKSSQKLSEQFPGLIQGEFLQAEYTKPLNDLSVMSCRLRNEDSWVLYCQSENLIVLQEVTRVPLEWSLLLI